MKKRISYFCLVFLILLFPAQVNAANTYYASAGGSGSCTQGSPCSIATAYGKTTAGDTVSVASGTYACPVTLDRAGTSSEPITIRSETKWGAIIDCGQANGAIGIGIQASYNAIDGFTIKSGKYGIALDSGYVVGIQILRNNIYDFKYSDTSPGYPSGEPRMGIVTDNTSASTRTPNQILYNYIHDNGVTYLDHGIYSRSTNDIIAHNIFANNGGSGGSQIDLSGNGALPLNGTKVYNNTIAYGDLGIEFYQNVDNVEVKNNILYQIATAAMDSYNCDSNGAITVDHNLFYGNGNSDQIQIGAGTCANRITETNSTRGQNPNLVNPSAGTDTGFMLQASSTIVLDRGVNLGSPYNLDYVGTDRNTQGTSWDIGAYEYGSAPPPPSSPALVLALAFEDGIGLSVTDLSGFNNTGTLTSGTTWAGSNQGKYGNAVTLNGNTEIDVAYSPNLDLTQFTISAWIYPTANPDAWRAVIHRAETSGYFYGLWSSVTSANCPVYGAAYSSYGVPPDPTIYRVCDTGTVTPNRWTYLTATYDGSTYAVYRDGNLVSSTNPVQSLIYNGSGSNLIIGNASNGTEGFTGKIDEVRIYNYARTQAQIQSDMNTPLVGTPGAVAGIKVSSGSSIKLCPTCSIKVQAQ